MSYKPEADKPIAIPVKMDSVRLCPGIKKTAPIIPSIRDTNGVYFVEIYFFDNSDNPIINATTAVDSTTLYAPFYFLIGME